MLGCFLLIIYILLGTILVFLPIVAQMHGLVKSAEDDPADGSGTVVLYCQVGCKYDVLNCIYVFLYTYCICM